MGLFRRTTARFVVWVAFLIAVAVVAGFARLDAWLILAVMAAAWLFVALVELLVSRRPAPARARATPLLQAAADAPDIEHVRVLRVEPPRRPVTPRIRTEPDLAPEPVVVPEPEREPAPVPRPGPDRAREPLAWPEREREPLPERVLVPEPAEPVAEPEPLPVAAMTEQLLPSAPRQWNLWMLQELTRNASGADALRDEERAYLLMYLREFASADGLLPQDFDSLVRESFGELLAAIVVR